MSTLDRSYVCPHSEVQVAAAPGVASKRSVGLLAATLLLLALMPALASGYDRTSSKGNQLILRAQSEDVAPIAAQYGLEVVRELHNSEGHAALVEAPASLTEAQIRDLLAGDGRVESLESVRVASLPESPKALVATEEATGDLLKSGDFTTPCFGQGFAGLLWSGYADQAAANRIRLHEGHLASSDCGAGTVVAILDTGVDPNHPLLAGSFYDGYDFLLDVPGVPSEWTRVDGTVAAIVEEEEVVKLFGPDGTVAAIVEQEQTVVFAGGGAVLALGSIGPILAEDGMAALSGRELPPAFGHGSMVAGLVRMVAPAARIMPLRVFGGDGRANLFDIVRAVYYAVDHGADVINMSFSMEEHSKELQRAIQYARNRGVVCVAASGNQNQLATVYPAAFGDSVGVASLTLEDTLSDFSNYGTGLIDLGAPGHGVVSAYPGGLYGAGWGTSFSTPLVAGTLALLVDRHPGSDNAAAQARINALRSGSEPLTDLANDIGSGRLDVLGTVLAGE